MQKKHQLLPNSTLVKSALEPHHPSAFQEFRSLNAVRGRVQGRRVEQKWFHHRRLLQFPLWDFKLGQSLERLIKQNNQK
jgi:hypothetical protein